VWGRKKRPSNLFTTKEGKLKRKDQYSHWEREKKVHEFSLEKRGGQEREEGEKRSRFYSRSLSRGAHFWVSIRLSGEKGGGAP